ncbi:MAG: hypothetical protein FD128_1914, partial [Hyphomonadaceae bacterium]
MLNWGDFTGRTRRRDFWQFILAQAVVYFVAIIIGRGIFQSDGVGILAKIILAIQFVPMIAAIFRRLHDSGNSAWLLLLSVVPDVLAKATPFILLPLKFIFWVLLAIGNIALLYYLVKDSDADNNFGSNPKAISA